MTDWNATQNPRSDPNGRTILHLEVVIRFSACILGTRLLPTVFFFCHKLVTAEMQISAEEFSVTST